MPKKKIEIENKVPLVFSQILRSKKYKDTYEKFLKSPEPMNLTSELASLRALTEILKDELQVLEDMPQNKKASVLLFFFKELSDITMKTAKIAEMMKKIDEGITIHLDMSPDTMKILSKFLQDCVFPHTDFATRQKIIESAKSYKGSMNPIGYEVLKKDMSDLFSSLKKKDRV